jgi:hypothetical protein
MANGGWSFRNTKARKTTSVRTPPETAGLDGHRQTYVATGRIESLLYGRVSLVVGIIVTKTSDNVAARAPVHKSIL